MRVRRADGDDARAELDADGDVVVRRKPALAKADGEAGFTASRVSDADELRYVVPRRRRHVRRRPQGMGDGGVGGSVGGEAGTLFVG